jgi:CheY-like chemotaxis protein
MASVLLVDDDLDAREMVALYLRKGGHIVRCSINGQDALASLMADTPDVVVLDARMPELDGVAFLEIIRCYLRWSQLPVILLTGYPNGPHIKRAAELGIRKIFLKADYDLADLMAHVEACGAPLPPPGEHRLPPHDSFN